MQETTIQKQENVLPGLGISFSFLPMTGRKEKEVIKAVESEPKLASSTSWQVFCTLAVMLASLGEEDWDETLPIKQRMRKLESLSLGAGDAYYMYAYLRREAIGEKLSLNIICPGCKETNKFTLNINDFKVSKVERPEEMTKRVELKHPLLLSGEKYKEVIASSVKFSPRSAFEDTSVDSRCRVISECISVPGYEFPISEELMLDQMAPVLRELFDALNDVTPGISENTSLECSNCRRTVPFLIGWEFPTFFA